MKRNRIVSLITLLSLGIVGCTSNSSSSSIKSTSNQQTSETTSKDTSEATSESTSMTQTTSEVSSNSEASSSSEVSSSKEDNKLKQQILDELKGNVAFKGELYKKTTNGNTLLSNAELIYGNDKVYFSNGNSVGETIYKNNDDATKYALSLKNQVSESKVGQWTDYANVFDSLQISDFEKVADNKFALSKEKFQDVIMLLSFFKDVKSELQAVEIYTKEDAFEKMEITLKEVSETESTYVPFATWQKETYKEVKNKPVPYEEKQEHQTLQDALTMLKTASYKASYKVEESGQEENFTFTYVENAVDYSQSNRGEGIAKVEDKYFFYTRLLDEITRRDEATEEDFLATRPSFEGEFSFALFEDKGNGKYETYDDYADGKLIAKQLAPYFVTEGKVKELASYAVDLSISLSSSLVQEISFNFTKDDGTKGNVVITYSDINSATLDFDLSILSTLVDGGQGSWGDGPQEDF